MDPTCDDVDSDDSGGSGAVDVVMIATDRYWYCRPSVVLLSLGCLPCPGPRNVRLVGVAVSVQCVSAFIFYVTTLNGHGDNPNIHHRQLPTPSQEETPNFVQTHQQTTMADLDNLLDEINNDVPDYEEEDDASQPYDVPPQDRPMRASIPAALTAAAAERDSVEYKQQEEEGESHLPDPEYEQLKSLWAQEMACPELMPADAETVSLHVDLLEGQEETIEHLLQMSKASQSKSSSSEASGELASLMAQITKMDLDRTRFMLVDLARTRMAKIENHALHNKTLVHRMTEEEVSNS